MIEQPGQVVRVEGGRAWVETERRSSCGDCSAQAGCGHAIIGKTFGGLRNTVQVHVDRPVNAGDRVVLGVREDALLKSSFAMYLVPLLGLIGGALLAAQLAGSGEDPAALAGAGVGFIAGLLWVRGFGGRAAHLRRFRPVILRYLGSAPGTGCQDTSAPTRV